MYFKFDGAIAQLGEHLPYKQGVTGSSPVGPTIIFKSGGVSEWLKEADCKSVSNAFSGSNPLSTTNFIHHAGVAQW